MFDGNSLKNSSLEGKVAIVTGSTQGLGEGIAHLFADRGISGLVITGRNAARGAKVKAALEAKGVKTVFVAADLASMDDTRKVVAEADKAFGRVDILVNSAGITDRGTIWDTKPELFDAMFAVNVRAPFFLMQDALTVMKREKIEGSIVNIISMSGHGGQSFITAYCASKGGADHADPNVAYSVMNHRIRVNGLTIGHMNTPGEDRIMKTYHGAEDGWLEQAEKTKPFGRLLEVDEVARAVAYLSSAESGMMTGSIIDFDQQVRGAGNSPPPPPAVLALAPPRRDRHRQRHGDRHRRRHRAETLEIRLADLDQHVGGRGDRREDGIGDRDDLGAARLGADGQRHRLAGIGREADRQVRRPSAEMKLACSAPMPATASTSMLRTPSLPIA